MADNAPSYNGTFDTLNVTDVPGNGPDTTSNSFLTLDFLLLEVRLVGSAIGIIYLGAHAALRRPPSAAKRPSKAGKKHKDDDDDKFTQGLLPSDAILFPVMAACMLVGLYYLIQYLKDPEILNKILRWYMTAMSTASLLTLYTHGIDLGTSFFFPAYWRGRDGKLRKAEQTDKSVLLCDDAGNKLEELAAGTSPLPGLLSWMTPTRGARALAWKTRGLLTQHAYVQLYARRVGEERITVRVSHFCALILSVATAVAYFSTTSPMLSNVLGHALCYGSFLLLSPTDLLTSTLVLTGLFFYDIFMVFYTPYMITVATTLDVPIKLQFEAASRKSMLGLGDIVIPGMVMAWALRLDLWLHYQHKIKYESTPLNLIEKIADGSTVTKSHVKHKEVKAPYVNVKGSWGDRLWTRGSLFLKRPSVSPPAIGAVAFPKPYFMATVVGYLLGMLVTLAMLMIFKHGQPALLYLVPGVLGSIYATAFARREFKQIWSYTEDGSLDKIDIVVELDSEGHVVKSIGKLENGIVDTTKDDKDGDDKDMKEGQDKDKKEAQNKSKAVNGKAGHADGKEKDHGKGARGHRRLVSITLDLPSDDEN